MDPTTYTAWFDTKISAFSPRSVLTCLVWFCIFGLPDGGAVLYEVLTESLD